LNAGRPRLAGDDDGFGDGHDAEAAWIEAVDLAARGGLRDGAGKGLAGRGADAGIAVVSAAGDLGTRQLRISRQGEQAYCKHRSRETYQFVPNIHFVYLFSMNEKGKQ
jgi:hypothetical protein